MFGDDRELLLVIHVITYLSSPGLEWFILYRNQEKVFIHISFSLSASSILTASIVDLKKMSHF